jgi:hypothetical protein
MSRQGTFPPAGVAGRIRHRLLVNALVDPDEAAERLPDGLRPHVTAGGAVVGCCLLALDALRPAWLPGTVGLSMRAVAHRLSVEWDEPDGRIAVGVYVPVRHSDSRTATAIGGRGFPGVHRRAAIRADRSGDRVRWTVTTSDESCRLHVDARPCGRPGAEPDVVGRTCLDATVAWSPDHRGRLEAARMVADHRAAVPVMVSEVGSSFLDGFRTATPAPAYLMSEVGVRWTRVAARLAAASEAAA